MNKKSLSLVIVQCAVIVALIGCFVYMQVGVNKPAQEFEITSAAAFTLHENGAVLLDLQSALAFENRHIEGALHVSLNDIEEFAKSLANKKAHILCYCYCQGRGPALSAAERLYSLGFKNARWFEPGQEWSLVLAQEPKPFRIITGEDAAAMLENQPGTTILLDVRSLEEYEQEHIEGAVLIPHGELAYRLDELPDKDATYIVFCAKGIRSKLACQVLLDAGYMALYDMESINEWTGPLIVPPEIPAPT
ncbi:MAG: rhodanese-like domain-containing protein [Clostridia bacterium]|nr:rhodanese-like domain-containing protein [Clostridia bacterium]